MSTWNSITAEQGGHAMTARDPREIADATVYERGIGGGSASEYQNIIAAARTALASEPDFIPEGEPDELRDLWAANMPRVSGCMYFAIPGEQPIHLDDDEARHVLAYLSEKRR